MPASRKRGGEGEGACWLVGRGRDSRGKMHRVVGRG